MCVCVTTRFVNHKTCMMNCLFPVFWHHQQKPKQYHKYRKRHQNSIEMISTKILQKWCQCNLWLSLMYLWCYFSDTIMKMITVYIIYYQPQFKENTPKATMTPTMFSLHTIRSMNCMSVFNFYDSIYYN